MRRLLSALVCFSSILAVPARGFALIQPYCSAQVTCTGGTPITQQIPWPGLSHPEIVPIFWGSYWNTGTSPSQGHMLGVLQYLANGPYFGALGQYGPSGAGVGPVRISPMAPINTGAVPATVTQTDVGNLVNSMIASQAVPPPAAGVSIMYLVFLPPGTTSSPGNDINYTWTTSAGVAYNTGWVHDDPVGIAHEIAESITGNVGVTNCTYHDGSAANQIADICGCWTEMQQGGTQKVQAYWSAADDACVIPEAWNGVYEYSGSGSTWTQVGGAVRQIYAGASSSGTCTTPPCLIATDTSDNVMAYSGTPLSWSTIGGPGAMFSVGQGWLMGIAPDTSYVARYTTSSGWTTVGSNCSGVYSGAFDLCTEYSGAPALYQPATNTWTGVGGPAAQLVVGPSWAAALDWRNRSAFLLPPGGNGSSWIATNHAASELFVGGLQTLAGRDLTSAEGVSAMTTSYTHGAYVPNAWQSVGGAGNDFALYGSSSAPLVGLNPDQSAIFHETAPIESPPSSWSQIRGATGRLVGQGAKLYATGPVMY